jgi:hypothetical protein
MRKLLAGFDLRDQDQLRSSPSVAPKNLSILIRYSSSVRNHDGFLQQNPSSKFGAVGPLSFRHAPQVKLRSVRKIVELCEFCEFWKRTFDNRFLRKKSKSELLLFFAPFNTFEFFQDREGWYSPVSLQHQSSPQALIRTLARGCPCSVVIA